MPRSQSEDGYHLDRQRNVARDGLGELDHELAGGVLAGHVPPAQHRPAGTGNQLDLPHLESLGQREAHLGQSALADAELHAGGQPQRRGAQVPGVGFAHLNGGERRRRLGGRPAHLHQALVAELGTQGAVALLVELHAAFAEAADEVQAARRRGPAQVELALAGPGNPKTQLVIVVDDAGADLAAQREPMEAFAEQGQRIAALMRHGKDRRAVEEDAGLQLDTGERQYE